MKSGKISNTVLKRSVLKRIKKRGEILAAKPCVGSDCAVLKPMPDSPVLMTTATGRWPVYSAANNIAAKGGRIAAVQCGITLAEESEEEDLKELISELERQSEDVGIPVSGGHTQVSSYVSRPVVHVTGLGYGTEHTKHIKVSEGLDIVASGYIGVSGIRRIAELKRSEILSLYSEDVLERAVGSEEELFAQKAAEIGFETGVCYMHDMSQGGIWAALWDMAEYLAAGFEVDFQAIPVRQEIIEVCEMFDINPYQLESIGGLLMLCSHGSTVVEQLMQEGIAASVIGHTISGKQKIIRNREEVRYLDLPKADELERFI